MFSIRRWLGPVVSKLRSRSVRRHPRRVGCPLRPQLETLERREVPTVSTSIVYDSAGAHLQAFISDQPETVTLDHGADVSGGYTTINGGPHWYDAWFNDVEIISFSDGTTVNVRGTPNVETDVWCNASNNTVNVGGGAHGVENIQGLLFVRNYSGQPSSLTLNIDDANSWLSHQQVRLDIDYFGAGYLSSLAPGLISWDPTNLAAVNITTGKNSDTVSIRATSSGVSTSLDSGGGDDIVNVGDNHSVQRIKGPLSIANTHASNYLTIDDSWDGTPQSVTHDTWTSPQGSVWGRISGLAPGVINYKCADTMTATVLTGGWNGNTSVVDVEGTGMDLTLVCGAFTTVDVGTTTHTVQNITHTLTIQDPPSYVALVVDDSGDGAARTTTLSTIVPDSDPIHSYGRITGLAANGTIIYRNYDTQSVAIDTSAMGGTTSVLATGVPLDLTSHGSTTINVGNPNDGVQDIRAALSLHGSLFASHVTISNAGDSGNRQLYYGVINGQGVLDGLSAWARIAFDINTLSSLVIQIGSGTTTFHHYVGGDFPLFTVWKDANGNIIPM
jgi:hypothetical protein